MPDFQFHTAEPAFSVSPQLALLLGGFAIALCFGWFLVAGYSMKFALALSGVGRFGFWRSLGIVSLTSLVGMMVSTAIMIFFSGEPFGILAALAASVFTFALLIARIGHCGIGRGLMVYFLSGMFHFLGTVPLLLATVVGGMALQRMGACEDVDLDEIRSQVRAQAASLPGASDRDWLGSELSELNIRKVVGPNALMSNAITQHAVALRPADQDAARHRIPAETAEEETEPAGLLPKKLPPVITTAESDGIFNSFFSDEKPCPHPKHGQDKSSAQSGGSRNSSEPVTRGLQANPYAK